MPSAESTPAATHRPAPLASGAAAKHRPGPAARHRPRAAGYSSSPSAATNRAFSTSVPTVTRSLPS
jgi:hypothetical protein